MVLSEVYFDESGTHQDSSVMTMAGYLFRSEQARRFERDWQKALDGLPISAAHMTDCANGNGEYANMTLEERVQSEKLLIENIKRRTIFGMSVSVRPAEYHEIIGEYGELVSPYTLLLMLAVVKVRDWAESVNYQGKIAYFFEAGHHHASEANRYMNYLSTLGAPAIDYNYYSAHAFVKKTDALALQAADMLAWQHRHFLVRRDQGFERPRADFLALERPKDEFADVSREQLAQLRTYMAAGIGVFEQLPERLRQIYQPTGGRP